MRSLPSFDNDEVIQALVSVASRWPDHVNPAVRLNMYGFYSYNAASMHHFKKAGVWPSAHPPPGCLIGSTLKHLGVEVPEEYNRAGALGVIAEVANMSREAHYLLIEAQDFEQEGMSWKECVDKALLRAEWR